MKKDKSGKESVEASRGVQQLNEIDNIYDMQNNKTVTKTIRENQIQKNIYGRYFYFSDNFWIDSKIQDAKIKTKVKQIKFASKEYFNLLDKYSETAQYLSLGQNVRFLLNNEIYEIIE